MFTRVAAADKPIRIPKLATREAKHEPPDCEKISNLLGAGRNQKLRKSPTTMPWTLREADASRYIGSMSRLAGCKR